jgi:hypothetical protein
VALSGAALLLIVWSLVLLRNDVLAGDAAQRFHSDPDMSEADWARTKEQLQDARFLDPSNDLRVDLANYLLLRDERQAAREARSVVSGEPENLGAWVALLKASQGRDARGAARAAEEIRRLNPLLGARIE